MTNFKDYFIDKQINIYIPALQRDYVQGANLDIIRPFLSVLNKALSNENEKVELNYIYGYEKDKIGFIPIDGQQRLITLWLVHLYLYSKQQENEKEFPRLSFESREYADNFSLELLKHYRDINNNYINDSSLDITDASWFISSWLDDITVVNMISTLNCIKTIFKDNTDSVYYDNISFYFKNLLESDSNTRIDDDIYLKMNGRGKPLSYYDNFKSFVDSQLSKLNNGEENINLSSDWRKLIDNEWTDLFWKNRNREQEFSENIDDEQIRLFYSLILIFYLSEKDKLRSQLEKENNLSKNDLETYLNYEEPAKKSRKDIIGEVSEDIISKLLKGEAIPLYWIEQFNLINEDSIKFIYEAMNVFTKLAVRINNLDKEHLPVKLFLDNKDNQTNFYIIALKEAVYANTIPYLYTIIKTPQTIIDSNDSNEDFKRYIRLIRNLVINTDEIWSGNIPEIFKAISEISNALNDDTKTFYQRAINLTKNTLNVFNDVQVEEEIQKIKKLNQVYKDDNENFNTLEETIFEAEQSLFLVGGINFLYLNSEAKEEWGSFKCKFERFKLYFKNDSAKTHEFKIYNEYINKIIQAYCNLNDFEFNKIKFTNSKSSWRKILTKIDNINAIHKILNTENIDDLITCDNGKKLTNVQERLKKLVKDQFFINFLLGTCDDKDNYNINERLNESIINENDIRTAILQEGKRCGLLFLSEQERDKTLVTARLNKKIVFSENINNILVDEHFKSQSSNLFLYQWNEWICFYYDNMLYSWEASDIIQKQEDDKWIQLDDIKKSQLKENLLRV